MKRHHFHTFDALRFFAFAKVFLLHLPITAFPIFNFFRAGGGMGVSFFFVLSGFLITYILLFEKKQLGSVNLRYFYFRRILRIWPLYYLMVGFAFITPYILQALNLSSSPEGYTPNLWMSLLFLENYQMIITDSHPNVSPLIVTWSLCIEEHFYLLWGLLFTLVPLKKLPFIGIALIVVAFLSRCIFFINDWPTIDLLTNVDYFVYGAVPAWLLAHQRPAVERWMSRTPIGIKVMVVLTTIGYVLASPFLHLPGQAIWEPLILGTSFSIVLCCFLPDNSRLRISERSPFTILGRYTYGFYLYHTILINFFIKIFDQAGYSFNNPLSALIFVVICLIATIGVGTVSYYLFESFFIRLKDRLYQKKETTVIEYSTPTSHLGSKPV